MVLPNRERTPGTFGSWRNQQARPARPTPFARSLGWVLLLSGMTVVGAACTASRPAEVATSGREEAPLHEEVAMALADPDVQKGAGSSVDAAVAEVTPPRGDAVLPAGGAPQITCPKGMLLVEGSYCPEVRHTCLRAVDTVGRYAGLRCAEFKDPPECVAPRVPMRFCIDREEYAAPGDDLPMVNVSWTRAAELCAARGARLCQEREWELACEGDAIRPYPYGFQRDSTACNIDQTHLGKPNEGLFDLRAKRDAFPACVSPFGVHDMTGNVDEWTVREGQAAPHRSALHGGWWLPGRNGCRPATLFHPESYQGKQVGFRCCGEAPVASGP